MKTSLFKDVGLDPTIGTGKMAFDLYDGKPDTSELGSWLKETYDIDTTVQQNNEVAAEKIAESDVKMTTINQNSVAAQPVDLQEQLQQVIAEGSVKDSIRAKLLLQEEEKNNK